MRKDDKKKVEYYKYCPICEYHYLKSTDWPCNSCILYPTNANSRKPVMFKELKEKEREVY